MSEIVAPKWGLTTEEMVLLEWLKQPGDTVRVDEAVAEVETDKTTAEVLSTVAGTITELLVSEGDEIKTGQPIARVTP
ncbi:biotin-dependent enzyme [Prauserella shujinwangii]|uniref:Biotin-dependent enzyme n=1 Tax=Prauserella shujinwangii TaxID=1453103 RepID=A0A2T0M1J8_9PSEU|nr:biotin/lipoyl-containing protein [Prauserella shujinwangii]PRX50453.1 biotin-dependent enzyme [Prauserella shujinwangii]